MYGVGDKMVIDGPEILRDKTDALCPHAPSALFHCATILEHDWCPAKLGLTTSQDPGHAYVKCIHAGELCTQGDTVIFECRSIRQGGGR